MISVYFALTPNDYNLFQVAYIMIDFLSKVLKDVHPDEWNKIEKLMQLKSTPHDHIVGFESSISPI